MQNVEIEVV